jgi:hypothetical protein
VSVGADAQAVRRTNRAAYRDRCHVARFLLSDAPLSVVRGADMNYPVRPTASDPATR